ncbi:hypothetical protein [Rhizobium wuzhouense]|nr:hypothetical protein [Rhizobium wuzhouense]
MDDPNLRDETRVRPHSHLAAVIVSLFASLLLLFGGDVSGRFHSGPSVAGALSRSDTGQAVAGGHGDTRFLTSADQSVRPKLRPWVSGDGCLPVDVPSLWTCRLGDLTRQSSAALLHPAAPHPYWSRAPPEIQLPA